MPETKYKLLNFRVEEPHLDRIDRLARKLKVSRSQAIRLCLDEAIAKYIEPGYKGELQVMNTEFLNTILTNLGSRIFELENPEAGKYKKAIEAGKEVDRLLKAGKRAEANELLRKREKEGKYTTSGFTWPESEKKK